MRIHAIWYLVRYVPPRRMQCAKDRNLGGSIKGIKMGFSGAGSASGTSWMVPAAGVLAGLGLLVVLSRKLSPGAGATVPAAEGEVEDDAEALARLRAEVAADEGAL